MQSDTRFPNDSKRTSRELRQEARKALLLAALFVPVAAVPLLLYALVGFLATNNIGDWGKNGNADIALLILFVGLFWIPIVAIGIVVMLIRAGIEFHKARKQKLETG